MIDLSQFRFCAGLYSGVSIPEQFDNFDLARHGNRNGAAQLYILFARFKRFGSLSGHAKQAGTYESGAEDQITHALRLGG